jgi:hypothetical protein
MQKRFVTVKCQKRHKTHHVTLQCWKRTRPEKTENMQSPNTTRLKIFLGLVSSFLTCFAVNIVAWWWCCSLTETLVSFRRVGIGVAVPMASAALCASSPVKFPSSATTAVSVASSPDGVVASCALRRRRRCRSSLGGGAGGSTVVLINMVLCCGSFVSNLCMSYR